MGAALVLATLLNGAGAFAKRVGLIDREAYDRYLARRCGPQGVKPLWLGLGRQCVSPKSWSPSPQAPTSLTAYIAAVKMDEWPLKAAKDLVVAGLLALGAVLCFEGGRRWPLGQAWLPILLLLHVLAWATVTVAQGRMVLALAGLRAFAFLPLGLLWASSTSTDFLGRVAHWTSKLVLLQLLLIQWEVFSGVAEKPTTWLRIRAAGTLVHPNTLGILAVAVLGFGLSFARSARSTAILWVIALVVVAAAGSGAGWVALAALAFIQIAARVRVPPVIKVLSGVALALLALSALATLTGRDDVLLSVAGGRISNLQIVIEQAGPWELVMGNGLGVGSNAAMTALGMHMLPADSMVTLLLLQSGLVGLALFYGTLLQAWSRTATGRPFFLSVLIASLVSNVVEVFPVNVLLGLALGESLPVRRLPDVRQ